MNRIFSTTGGLALLALLVVFATVIADQPWPGFPTLQSTAPTTPCLTATEQGFTFAFYGYLKHPDGTSTLTWQVTNSGKHDISHVAFGTAGWTRLAPQPGSLYRGELGAYPVEWTKDKGHPGFASVKYESQFTGFSQGASDTFTLTVSGFDPATPVQVQAKAGRIVGVVTFTLADPVCDRTPTPTPTPTPASPLPTPTAAQLPSAERFRVVSEIPLTHEGDLFGEASISPDGRLIAFSSSSTETIELGPNRRQVKTPLWLMDVEGNRTLVAEYGVWPVWVGHGEHLAFVEHIQANSVTLHIYNVVEGKDILVKELVRQRPSRLNDGSMTFIENQLLYAWKDGATRLLSGFTFPADADFVEFYPSPDGTYAAYVRARQLWLIDLQTQESREITLEIRNSIRGVAWSPNADRIAIVTRLGGVLLYRVETDARETLTALAVSGLLWVPNSEILVFNGKPIDGHGTATFSEIYLINSDGTGLNRLTTNEVPDYAIAWEASKLALLTSRSTPTGIGRDLYLLPLEVVE